MDKSQEMTDSSTPEMHAPPKTQQKKGSKLFSFLGCCGSSEVDNEDVQPAKRTTMRPPATHRLAPPDKGDTHTGDSYPTESRDLAFFHEEKAPLAARTEQPLPSEEEYNQGAADAQRADTSAAGATQTAPPVGLKDHEGDVGMANGLVVVSQTDGVNEIEEKAAVKEEPTKIEPTAESPVGSENASSVPEGIVTQTKTILPPPPSPPPLPATPAAPLVTSQTEEEEVQPLLPPPLPHLENRKCLVLDLDETLVHSSFKVGQNENRCYVDVLTHQYLVGS